MPPTTRSQAQHRQSPDATSDYSSSSDPETDTASSIGENDDDDPTVVHSPTKLAYNLEQLIPEARHLVRETFSDPPRLSIDYCRLKDNVYAFQMTERVHRSIRIGSPGSPYATPKCSCRDQEQHKGEHGPPCEHILWFLDQLVKQTLYDHDPTSPLTMTAGGFPEEAGDPFTNISTFHLDILAEGLRCNVVMPESGESPEDHDPESDSDPYFDSDPDLEPGHEHGYRPRPNPCRVQEARELLSAVVAPGSPPGSYRPDLFTEPPPTGKKPLKRRDLEATIFRMLLANDDFFRYFLSQASSTDPVNDPFRKLSQRVDRVLRELDTNSSPSSPPLQHPPEGPRDVAWAAHHITGAITLIRTAIFNRDRPLRPRERTSAAGALIRILAAVADRNRDFAVAPGQPDTRRDRNLYLRLVGDRDQDFVLGVLNLLPPDAAAPFLHHLELVQDQFGVNGAPASYVERFRSLLARVRRAGGVAGASTSAAAGSKRQGQGQVRDRGPKRMK
ncbi:hypothetical protein CCHL11_02950 [Colletotrichum chlorophyti]|uniref:SWIM-type domain-containing protein n=1 Tax=Colletotrichum chlorophyti TaxID=708187 RepID=A0A1Q8S102_9PEZI|nr:hypothetical protein CCHL11_02950 [Colletotrichum chlorophyti]